MERARAEGFARLVVRAPASGLEPPDVQALARAGADTLLVPLFSEHATVHDRVAATPGALVRSLVAMRAADAEGLRVELEIPLLSSRLQSLTGVVELAARAVPRLETARFFVSPEPLPQVLTPDGWDVMAPRLSQAVALCGSRGIRVELPLAARIPFCALSATPEALGVFRFRPGAHRKPDAGMVQPSVCETCVVRRDCPGVDARALARDGEAGLVAFASRPAALYDQSTTPRRRWSDEQRQAARQTRQLVLRPTVNCNQDCTFCSANETTANVWSDRGQMLRAIARAARRGVDWLSLSGGEPTLSPDLPMYVRAARRTGIRTVEIVTNAVLLDTPRRVRALAEAGLTNAFVSLHAHDEATSQAVTRKAGDHARTVKAIHLLLEHGVSVTLNHVINERNRHQLTAFVEFVHREWNGRVDLSFAFVTPQFRGLEHLELMPRYTELMPQLRRALHRAVALGQSFVVGSRQGIPPCQLGEFEGWSDVMGLAAESGSEDEFQKSKAPQCAGCRWTSVCRGVWKPYAARYGTDELRPIPGSEADLEAIRAWLGNDSFHGRHSFEDLPAPLRYPQAEEEGRRLASATPPAAPRMALPVVEQRSRPVRVALFGSGARARYLASSMSRINELSLDVVASPHAPDADQSDFGGAPAMRDPAQALDEVRPEAVIIAARTTVHLELARLTLNAGAVVLLEKPLGRTLEEGETLVGLVETTGGLLLAAHQSVFSPGLERAFARPTTRARWVRRTTPDSSDAPRAWTRSSLFETAYHGVSVLQRVAGAGVATVTAATWHGGSRPTLIRATLRWPGMEAELLLDFASNGDEAALTVDHGTWRRRDGALTWQESDGEPRRVESDGNDTTRMLRHFRDVALGKAQPLVTAQEGLDTFRVTKALLDALAAAGAPVDEVRVKHVATPSLRTDLR